MKWIALPALLLALLSLSLPTAAPAQAPKPTSPAVATVVPEPKGIAVRASLDARSGLAVAWSAAQGARHYCVFRLGVTLAGDLLGCAAASPWRQGTLDVGMLVEAGGVVEVRAYGTGEAPIAAGRAVAVPLTYLPSMTTPRR